MRVEHVVPSLQGESSGPSHSVRRLCEALVAEGLDVGIVTAGTPASPVRVPRVAVHPSIAMHAHALAPGIVRPTYRAFASAEIVHNHGLWAFPNIVAGLLSSRGRAHLITSPRGTLSRTALGFSMRTKRLAFPLQLPVLSRATCLHATSDAEVDDIRAIGLRAPVAVIPNGIDVPSLGRASCAGPRRALFLGRLHPIKGVELLLDAWKAVSGKHPDWELFIVGQGDEAYERTLRSISDSNRVSFRGAVYGEEKAELLRSASLFILPTKSENFGMAVAEALACGVPVITTHGAPWSGLEVNRCGFWIHRGLDELVYTLSRALEMEERELMAMGDRGRAWMLRDFDWPSIARRMAAVYQWIVRGGARPVDVRVDP